MSKINDGGPAFPQHDLSGYGMGPSMRGPTWTDPYNPPEDLKYTVEGMSLRDYFAIHADVSKFEFHNADDLADKLGIARFDGEDALDVIRFGCEVNAAIRYRLADAMLAERAKGGVS